MSPALAAVHGPAPAGVSRIVTRSWFEAPAQAPGGGELGGGGPHAGGQTGEERRAQGGGLRDLRPLDRDLELVGLQLHEQAVGAGPTVGAQRARAAPVTG